MMPLPCLRYSYGIITNGQKQKNLKTVPYYGTHCGGGVEYKGVIGGSWENCGKNGHSSGECDIGNIVCMKLKRTVS